MTFTDRELSEGMCSHNCMWLTFLFLLCMQQYNTHFGNTELYLMLRDVHHNGIGNDLNSSLPSLTAFPQLVI